MASSTSRGVARTPGAIPPSRTARGITPGAQYALSPFVTDASLFRQLRAPPPPTPPRMPGADSAATTQGAPRREPRLPPSCCASPSPPLQPRKCASCPRPPANHAHGRRTRAGRTHARAACGPVCCHGAVPTPAHSAASARPGRWQQGGGWGRRALLLVLEVRAGVEAGAAGATQAWRAGEGCCQRWRRCSGLPPGSSRRLFPEAWLDPALAMTSSPPADELKQIRVILGLRSQGCYSPLPPGLKPTLS